MHTDGMSASTNLSYPPEAPPSPRSGPRRIVLVAHDNRKADLISWARHNHKVLAQHVLHATGTTGRRLRRDVGLEVEALMSGPLGGDQQVGAMIAQGDVDLLVFFWDPLEPQPHDPDVRAVLRIATLWNVATACNRTTADMVITSPLFDPASEYHPMPPPLLTLGDRARSLRHRRRAGDRAG
jgi:methylglyoxal synthase